MSTVAKLGYGTLLKLGQADGPPETFVTVSEVLNLEPPDEVSDDVEVTNHDSPNRTREYIQGLIETGEVPFTINWNPSSYTNHWTGANGLYGVKDAGAARNWQVVFPSGIGSKVFAFPAYIKSIKVNPPVDAQITADVVLKVSGAITRS